MRAKLTPLIDELKGSVGNFCFTTNNGCQILGKKPSGNKDIANNEKMINFADFKPAWDSLPIPYKALFKKKAQSINSANAGKAGKINSFSCAISLGFDLKQVISLDTENTVPQSLKNSLSAIPNSVITGLSEKLKTTNPIAVNYLIAMLIGGMSQYNSSLFQFLNQGLNSWETNYQGFYGGGMQIGLYPGIDADNPVDPDTTNQNCNVLSLTALIGNTPATDKFEFKLTTSMVPADEYIYISSVFPTAKPVPYTALHTISITYTPDFSKIAKIRTFSKTCSTM